MSRKRAEAPADAGVFATSVGPNSAQIGPQTSKSAKLSPLKKRDAFSLVGQRLESERHVLADMATSVAPGWTHTGAINDS
jgi:hypothetical protein